MNHRISVIIPNYNGESTIGKCLAALFASHHDSFEVIVVDDCSTDNSITEIEKHPCRLITLKKNVGAAAARNIGAEQSKGEILFFTDADCVVYEDTLLLAENALREAGAKTVLGGTYSLQPYDKGFFSLFQSIFINYSETKHEYAPDYIATHAMAITADYFKESGGFKDDFLPILEDVEFSHRVRRGGGQLTVRQDILVRHIFNYSLISSMRNAFVKSMYWTMYSLRNRDLFSDSGTASIELKINVLMFLVIFCLCFSFMFFPGRIPFLTLIFPVFVNGVINRRLLRLFYLNGGMGFALMACLYYMFVYPFAVGLGGLSGLLKYQLPGRRAG